MDPYLYEQTCAECESASCVNCKYENGDPKKKTKEWEKYETGESMHTDETVDDIPEEAFA